MDDFAFLDATAQADLVRRKQVKPIELVDAAIERIERLNPQLNAVVTPMYTLARKAAEGPLPAPAPPPPPPPPPAASPPPPPQAGRPHRNRQDQHAGVRPHPHHRAGP